MKNEVVSFFDFDSGGWVYKADDNYWYGCRRYTYDELIKNNPIRAVKRPDGKVFSCQEDTTHGKIVSFEIEANNIYAIYERDNAPFTTKTFGRVPVSILEKKSLPLKPPLGVTPEWMHRELRIADLADAIVRSLLVNKIPEKEWLKEYNEHRTWLNNRDLLNKQTNNI